MDSPRFSVIRAHGALPHRGLSVCYFKLLSSIQPPALRVIIANHPTSGVRYKKLTFPDLRDPLALIVPVFVIFFLLSFSDASSILLEVFQSEVDGPPNAAFWLRMSST